MAAKSAVDTQTVDDLFKALAVLARTVNHIIETRAVEAAIGESYSPSKVQILRLLGQRGAQNSSRVAYYLGVSKPAVSQIIDAMVRDKLVGRRTAEHDRREVELRLTPKGKQCYQAVKRQQRHLLRSALREQPAGTAQRWTQALHELSGAVAQADRSFKDYCLQCGAHADETCVLTGGDADCRFLR
ncbi:MAG: winged helix DNA-binding protein [Planctomycetes bacterium]|nr:winged helix DNA-binding protein [Planctomycetota bacterium]